MNRPHALSLALRSCLAASIALLIPASAGAAAPFSGTPAAVPGTIQAEDFDTGGEGVSYHDTTAGNSGDTYRWTDVDIEPTATGGYDVGWIAAGEWLQYTVNVAAAGTYTVRFVVASLGPGGTFHLEANGVNATGTITIPDTGGWQNWQTVLATATLGPGVQSVRLVMDTWGENAVGNFDTIALSADSGSPAATPYTGTPATIPGTIEAENFDNGGEGVAYHDTTAGNAGGAYRSTDVDLEPAASGGFDVGWVAAGEWLQYSVNVSAAGSYTARFVVASLGQGGTFHLEMNGRNVSGPLTIPDTGGWQNWQAIDAPVTLAAGPQPARLVMDTSGTRASGNFDTVTFIAVTSSPSATPYTGTPAAIPGTIEAENFDRGGEGLAYHDTTGGNSGGAYRQTDVDIEPVSTGGYDVGWITPGEWLQYTVNVATAGTYTARFSVASLGQGGTFHLEMNGTNVTGTVAIPDTGGWQNWQTIGAPIALGAGPQVARLVMDSWGANAVGNFDAIVFVPGTTPPPAAAVPPFSHVYVIVMENHEFSSVIGNPAAPYINSLASQYALGTAYSGVMHPSLPNYMAMTSGNTYFTDDCIGCTANATNIADQIEAAGRSWKAYLEGMPSACDTTDTGTYATKHNPFVHYSDIVTNVARCSSHVVPFTQAPPDLASAAPASFFWITPDLCDDMHDCDVATGDAWLASVVPQIQNAADFAHSVLFLVWDEGTTTSGGGGQVPFIVVSPLAKSGFRSTVPENHYNLLRTIEDGLGLPPLGQAANVPPMTEYFNVP